MVDTTIETLTSTAERRPAGDGDSARDALAEFGANFLRKVVGSAANTAISPYSLFTVLAMARAGADGDTARQIDAALTVAGTDAQGAVISAVDAGITNAIAASENLPRVASMVIRAANQTWVQNRLPVRQQYLDALAAQYGVEAVAADFGHDPDGMRRAINGWVSERTNALIPELFPQDSISNDTVLVLVNALYFKAAWKDPFVTASAAPFHTGGGATVPVPMMRSLHRLQGAAGDGWTSVTIPYAGRAASMTLLVPDPGRYDAVLAQFDARTLAAAANSDHGIALTMPLFSVRSTPDAKQIAQQLGIVDIFTTDADLSGIAGPPGYLIADQFVHQTVVTVDENGTEAAAATGMTMVPLAGVAGDIIALTVDRPFLFWISESRTGAPLFLATVTDPTA